MMDVSEDEQRSAFSIWLRTGRSPSSTPAIVEVKFNPWHDPKDGRFTFVGMGRYFPGGGGGNFGGGGATGSWTAPATPQAKPQIARRISAPPIRRRNAAAGAASAALLPKAGAATGSNPATAPTRVSAPSLSPPLRYARLNGYEWYVFPDQSLYKVEGYISFGSTHPRSRTLQRQAGGVDRRPSDDGGHYIAHRFNGPSEAFNHFAQDANFNRGQYRALENQWAHALRQGKQVKVKIVPVFTSGSRRPRALNIWFWINGDQESLRIPNEAKGST